MESDYSGDSVDFTYTFNEYYTLEEMAEDRADCSWMEEYEEYSNIVPGEVQEMEGKRQNRVLGGEYLRF